MNIFIALIFGLFFLGCGKLEIPLESPSMQQKIIYSIETEQSRITSQNFSIFIEDGSGPSPTLIKQHASLKSIINLHETAPTGVFVAQEKAYISYGNVFAGHVDIIDIFDRNNPKLKYTYESMQYGFADIKGYKNYIILAASHLVRQDSTLIIVDIKDIDDPKVLWMASYTGSVPINLDISGDDVSFSTSKGMYRYNISDINNPVSIVSENGSILYGIITYLYSIIVNLLSDGNIAVGVSSFNDHPLAIEKAGKITRQNSLLYMIGQDPELNILDFSQTLHSKPLVNMSSFPLQGPAAGIAHSQQLIYLAENENGLEVIDVSLPDAPISFGVLVGKPLVYNVWVYDRSQYKNLFLREKDQISFLSEDFSLVSSNKIRFFARGRSVLGSSAQVMVLVNGEVFDKKDLDNENSSFYELDYSRPLTSADQVEVVFLESSNQAAFVSYLNVNGFFCYQTVKPNLGDIGLFNHLQSISIKGTKCNTGHVPRVCSAGSIKSPTAACSLSGGRIGQLTCDSNEMEYTCQDSGTCEVGFARVGSDCIPLVCTPNQIEDCSDSSGVRSRQCNSTGTELGQCVLASCNAGYTQQGENCVPQICSPGSKTACGIPNGMGEKECSYDGLSYGSCELISCDSGYYNDGGTCQPQVCIPNSIMSCQINNFEGTQTCSSNGDSWSSCESSGNCQNGYNLSGALCLPNVCVPLEVTSCSENNGVGTKVCSITGAGFDACVVTSCDPGFHMDGGECLPNICSPNQSYVCSFPNGTGQKLCNPQGSDYGVCSPTGCDSGFAFVNGQCEPQVCAPNQTVACSESNGMGTRTCDSTGMNHSSCQLDSCNPGYYFLSGLCLPQSCTPNTTVQCVENHFEGIKTCNSEGSSLGACVVGTTCEAGYYNNNGVCEIQACIPNEVVSCSEQNGSGTKQCSANGSAYNNCSLNSCDSGYYLDGGVCAPQLCSPFSTNACFISQGTGSQVCNAQGSAYDSCQLQSCNPGFHPDGNNCASDVISCSVANGSGTRTWDSASSTYGSCVVNSCQAGFYLSGGTCVAQICSPSTSTSCAIVNGAGTQTCNTEGSGYGSCQLSSCNSGYHADGSSCSPDVIACSIGNGTGTQTWNLSTSLYESCQINSCNPGYYLSGGVCLPQACAPNSTTSCSVGQGSGTMTCNGSGSAYGSCQINSCNSGYHIDSGVCVSDVVSCSVSNGTGAQTWNGSSYAACQVTSCNAGYYNNGSSCQPQACAPGSSTACPITNGSGLKICDAQGSGYGSCNVNSCNASFHNESNACVSNSRSCPIQNGSGNQTWNTGTQAWNTCNVTSCISDAYQSGNSCVLYCPNPLLIHVVILGAHVCL